MVRWTAAAAYSCLVAGSALIAEGHYRWDGGLLLIVGLLLLLRIWIQSCAGQTRLRVLTCPPSIPWLALGSTLLSLIVAGVVRNQAPDAGFAGVFLMWLVALALLIVPWGFTLWRTRRTGVGLQRGELLGVVVLLAVAGAVRGIALDRIPANVGGDEGTQLAAALALVSHPLGNPFATGWYSVPTMSFLVYGYGMRVFGASVAGGRAVSAIAGTVGVLSTFLLARELLGRQAAWIASILVACSAYSIHFSRLASNQVFDPLIGATVFWLLLLGERRAVAASRWIDGEERGGVIRRAAWGLAGVVMGLGWYGYFGARWVTGLAGLYFLWRAWVEPRWLARCWRALAALAWGLLVTVLPLLGWYTRHPSALVERYRAVSIFASGWLAREIALTGRSAADLLMQQLWRAFTAFHVTSDPTFWYRPERPLLDAWVGALMLLGLLDALRHVRWPSRGLLLLWWGSTTLMAWGLTENPPSSQRGLLLMPAVALLAACGLQTLVQLLQLEGTVGRLVMIGLLVIVSISNVEFYFGRYSPRRVYGNPSAEAATTFARWVMEHPGPICSFDATMCCRGRVYFLGAPFIYWRFGTLRFMLRDVPGRDVASKAQIPKRLDHPARFAVVPERLAELDVVRSRFPSGHLEILRAHDGRPLMYVYDWCAEPETCF